MKLGLLYCETSLISRVVTSWSCENLSDILCGSKDGISECSCKHWGCLCTVLPLLGTQGMCMAKHRSGWGWGELLGCPR